MSQIPVAVLTNGALLYLPEVRAELAAADIVLPSLDSACEATYRLINRPLPELTLASLLEGLTSLRREFRGQIWLEVMLLKGLNDTDEELTLLRRALTEIAPGQDSTQHRGASGGEGFRPAPGPGRNGGRRDFPGRAGGGHRLLQPGRYCRITLPG